jgi:hypothetical protein
MPEPEGEGKKAVSTAKYVERREKPKSRACLHQQLLHVVARGADLLARANWGKKGRKEFSTYPCFRSPSPGRRRLAGARSGRRLPHRPKLSSVRCSGGPARVSLLRKKVLGGVPSEHREKAVLPRRAKPMPRHAPFFKLKKKKKKKNFPFFSLHFSDEALALAQQKHGVPSIQRVRGERPIRCHGGASARHLLGGGPRARLQVRILPTLRLPVPPYDSSQDFRSDLVAAGKNLRRLLFPCCFCCLSACRGAVGSDCHFVHLSPVALHDCEMHATDQATKKRPHPPPQSRRVGWCPCASDPLSNLPSPRSPPPAGW